MAIFPTSAIPSAAAAGITPSEHFNTVTYTGNGTSQSITGVGFQPDFVWGKIRSGVNSHALQDVLRGQSKTLFSDAEVAESEYGTNVMSSFDSDGFSVGGYGLMNGNSATYVAWNWKAGGTGASNTNGSITSTVSANADAGFSIVSYTGNSTPNSTVGHGLSSAPEMIICKNRSAVKTWIIGSDEIAWTKTIQFTTAAATTHDAFYNTAPSSSVFTIGDASELNSSGNSIIAYCFHSVDGYSKVGSYTGNGSTTGTTVSGLDFTPKFIMIKRSDSTGNWIMLDDVRDTSNPRNAYLMANSSASEATGKDVDFNSGSFQIKTTDSDVNASGGTYIYLAIAG